MTTDRAPRSLLRLPVSIGGRQAALSADVSGGGFSLETTSLLPEGLPVKGYVLHGEKELTWSGVVAWTRVGNPMTSTWHVMGVRFTKVSPGLRALISMRTR